MSETWAHKIKAAVTNTNAPLETFKERVEDLANTAESRNTTLNTVAFIGGKLVAAGHANGWWVKDQLRQACIANGVFDEDGETQFEKTFHSGYDKGLDEYVPVRRTGLKVLTIDELNGMPSVDWLIDGFLMRDSLSMFVAPPGVGKSFMALDIIGHVAGSSTWQGRSIRDNGPALYVAAEGASGLRQRVAAWEEQHGRPIGNVQFVPQAVEIGSPEWTELVEHVGDTKPYVIVLDTLARMAVGLDENHATEMGKFIVGIDQLRHASGGTVIVVHHSNKSGSTRGSSALDGAMDTIVRLYKEEKQPIIEVFVTKNKEGEALELGEFALKSVGESACFVRHSGVPWENEGANAE